MTEWITTGQMIDRLKVGEMAENHHYGKSFVVRQHSGIYFCDENKNPILKKKNGFFNINAATIAYKWRIVPRYVSFEEAMKALKEGATVRAWDGMEGMYEFSPDDGFRELAKAYSVVSLGELAQMKWTIVGDDQ